MTAEAKNLRDLSSVLRTSFQSIKRDIAGHAERLEANEQRDAMLHHHVQELERVLGLLSADFITNDKLNVLKIQMAGLKDELKRIDTVEKALRDVRSIVPSKQATEQAIADLRAELETKHSQWRANLKTLTATADRAFEKINKNLTLVQTVNNKDIDSRMAVFRNEFDRRLAQATTDSQRYAQKTDALVLAHQKRTAGEFQRLVRKSQLNELVRGVNAEFNTVKDSLATLGDDHVQLNETMRSLQHRTRDFENLQKQFATVHSNFEALKSKVVADLHDVQGDVERLGKKVKENIPPKELRSAARLLHLKAKTPQLVRTSNMFISFAVALIVFAAILFFALVPAQRFITEWTVGLAVVVFIVGLIFRIVHAVKK